MTPVRSLLGKASDILSCFSPERTVLTQAQITRRAGLPHTTARRIIAEMVEYGLLGRTEEGEYAVGLRLWELGALSPRALPLRSTAMPFMTVLNQAIGQHVQLAVQEEDEAVVVERLSARRAVGVVSQVGGRLPLHASGVGKALMAYAGVDELSRLLARPLPQYTDKTITDPEMLRRDLAKVRQRGYAMVRDETSLGASSIAVPIRTASDGVLAALSVVVTSDFTGLEGLAPGVASTAKAIGDALSHRIVHSD
jgi:DNA-binding IclR family transcriptional regulator